MSDDSGAYCLPVHLWFTPELKLVAACSWIPDSDHAVRQNHIINALSNAELNWDEVRSLVLRHGVVGQFCTVMGKRGWGNVPTETRDHLKRSRTQQVVRALGQVAELAKVARLFTEAGIPLIPLKGVALSQELYGDPCVRSSSDIDVLVKPEHVEKAEGLLVKAGYQHAFGLHEMPKRQKLYIINTLHHHEYVNNDMRGYIELHWRSYLWKKEQVAALWDASRSLTWLDAGLTQLLTEENILFLADHGARHDWPCLKWLSDIAMLMQNMPEDKWLSLYNRAVFFDLQRVVCQTALLLEWFYGIKSPPGFRKSYTSNAIIQKLAVNAASQLLASGDEFTSRKKIFIGLRFALHLKQLKPATPLSELFYRRLIISEDFVEIHLPDGLFWLYLLLRPFFWFKRHYLKK